jgi:hypothetical protein
MSGDLSSQAGLQTEINCRTIQTSRPPNWVSLVRRHILPFIEFSFLSLFCADILEPHTFERFEHGGIGCWKIQSGFVCTSCSIYVGWAWVTQYEGYHFTSVIYVCPDCDAVIKAARQKPCISEPTQTALLRGTQ